MTRREVFMVEAPEQHVLWREDRIANAPAADAITAYQQQLYLAIAQYSAGAALEDVRASVAKAVAHLANANAPISFQLRDPEQYYAAIWGLALSMLFGDASPVFAQALAGQDALVDRLLQLTDSKLEPSATLLHPKPFQDLLNAMDAPADAATHIASFLQQWYAAMGRTPWHDTHLRQDPSFFGYWSFELAAVVKALSITDASFDTNIFFPRDLVHQRLFRTWLDTEEGEAERRFKAAMEAQRNLEIAKKALGAFFSGELIAQNEIEALDKGLKLLASVMGLEVEALARNPQLVHAGLIQLFQAAQSLSQSTLESIDHPEKATQSSLAETMRAIAAETGQAELDLEEASKALAASEGFATASDPEARLKAARERLENMHSTLDKLVEEQKTASASSFGGLEKFAAQFAKSLGITLAPPRDIASETAEEVHQSLSEANKKNMIGSDFDWNALFKKQD